MFGVYRLMLALAVVVMHLSDATRVTGYYAVFAFYILSGYLMTLVLNRTYSFRPSGVWRFAVNRFLRVYPPYWVAAGLSATVILLAPEIAESHRLGMPYSISDWAKNIGIIGHIPPGTVPRLIRPVWTLHVELVYYLGMAAFLSRSKRIVQGWFVASLLYTGASLFSIDETGEFVRRMYFTTAAGSLPFSIGAMLYYYRESVARFVRFLRIGHTTALLLAISYYTAASITYDLISRYEVFVGLLYVSLAVSTICTCVMLVERRGAVSERVDRICGDLSYPIYLLHWTAAAIIVAVAGTDPSAEPLLYLGLATVVGLLLSYGINVFVESPIERIRKQVRSRKAKKVQLTPSAATP